MDAAPPRQRPSTRVSLGLVLGCLAITLIGGLAVKGPCASGGWGDGRQYDRLCYTDIVPLYGTEQLEGGRLPYLDACEEREGSNCDEYPVLTMYSMRLAAWTSASYGTFFASNAVLLTVAAIVTAVLLFLIAGGAALMFALAPTLLIYGYMNWDLLAVVLATAAAYALVRERSVAAGVLLGLGAAMKLYPALFVIPFAAERFRRRDPDGGIHLTWAAIGTWLAVNLPFALVAPGPWSTFFRFNAERGADWDSLWFIACDRLTGAGGCVGTGLIGQVALVAFIGLAAVVWGVRRSRDPNFPRWTLGLPLTILFLLPNKVYSPQYGLWLLPWFVLGLPSMRPGRRVLLFAAFEAADVAVFITRFSFFGRLAGTGGYPIGAFELAVVIRAAILIAVLVIWTLQRTAPEEAEEQAPERSGVHPAPVTA